MDHQKFLNLLNFTDLESNSLLILATLKNDIETVKTLLEEGANVNHYNFNDKNILTIANEFKDRTLIDKIFPQYLDRFDEKTKNSLLTQISNSNMHLLNLYGLKPNEAKENALHEAIKKQDLVLLEKLLKEGIDPNKPFKDNPNVAYSLTSRKIDFALKALTLLDRYGLDKTQKTKEGNNLSFYLLNAKPSQVLFNYLEKNNYPIQLSSKSIYGNNIFFIDMTQIKLNNTQIKQYIIDTVNKTNYIHVEYDTIETLNKNDNSVIFQIAKKIMDNNWPLQVKMKKAGKYDNHPKFFDLFETLFSLRYTKSYFRGQKMPTYFLSSYPEEILMNDSQQSYETKTFTEVKDKTEFNFKKYHYQQQTLEEILRYYSLEDFQIKSSSIDFSNSDFLNDKFRELFYHKPRHHTLLHFEKLINSNFFDINHQTIEEKRDGVLVKKNSFLMNYLSTLVDKHKCPYDWQAINEIEDTLGSWMSIVLSKPIDGHLINEKGESVFSLFKKLNKSNKLDKKSKNLLNISLEKWSIEESMASEDNSEKTKKLKI
jgi:hypothetical protein